MDLFETAFQHILVVEGTQYSNRASDRGGPTRYGITIKTLSAYRGKQATEADVKDLRLSEARAIYRKFYWDELNLDLMPPKIGLAMFDQAVNGSPYRATFMLQIILGTIPDGRLGPITISKAVVAIEKELVADFLNACMIRYVRICENDQTQMANLAGWTNRVFRLVNLLLI